MENEETEKKEKPTIADVVADAAADIDQLSDEKSELVYKRMKQLLQETDERDVFIWNLLDADPNITVQGYLSIPIQSRDDFWESAMRSCVAACLFQCWVEIFGIDMLELSEKSGREILKSASNMEKAKLIEAAKIGVSKQKFDDARKAKSNTARPYREE